MVIRLNPAEDLQRLGYHLSKVDIFLGLSFFSILSLTALQSARSELNTQHQPVE